MTGVGWTVIGVTRVRIPVHISRYNDPFNSSLMDATQIFHSVFFNSPLPMPFLKGKFLHSFRMVNSPFEWTNEGSSNTVWP